MGTNYTLERDRWIDDYFKEERRKEEADFYIRDKAIKELKAEKEARIDEMAEVHYRAMKRLEREK